MKKLCVPVEMFGFSAMISSYDPNIFGMLLTGSHALVLRSTEARLSLKETLEKVVVLTPMAEQKLRQCTFATIQEDSAQSRVLLNLWSVPPTSSGCEATIKALSFYDTQLSLPLEGFHWLEEIQLDSDGMPDLTNMRSKDGTPCCTGSKFEPLSMSHYGDMTSYVAYLPF